MCTDGDFRSDNEYWLCLDLGVNSSVIRCDIALRHQDVHFTETGAPRAVTLHTLLPE